MRRASVWVWLAILLCLWAAGGWGTLDPDLLLPEYVDFVGMDDTNSPLETITYSPSPDAIGRLIAFARHYAPTTTDPADIPLYDVWVRDRGSGRSYLITNAEAPFGYLTEDGYHDEPVISADGSLVAFISTGYSPWDPWSGITNVFISSVPSGGVERVSVSNSGQPALGACREVRMSPDGRYVVYTSTASNLVFGDNNGASDVFLRDRLLGVTELISVNNEGAIGNGASFHPDVSADGRFVVFASEATNLVPGDTNNVTDIFLRDRLTGTTTRINYSNWGEQANMGSMTPSISGDGRIIAYSSLADNLVPGDHDLYYDIYVYDRVAGTTERVSVSEYGRESNGDCFDPNLDYTGSVVIFESDAPDLDPVWAPPQVNAEGERVSYLFERDRVSGTTRALIRAFDSNGVAIIPNNHCRRARINRLGNYVAFTTEADNLSEAPGAQVYTRWEGRTFADVPTFYWAYDAIQALYQRNIILGFQDPVLGLVFRPLDPTTRAAMAVLIARVLCGGDANVPYFAPPGHFSDVPPDHWAFNYIEYVYWKDIIRGYDDGTFDPDGEVDRGQMAIFIARALCDGDAGVPPGPASASFPDVPTDHPAFKYVEYLKQQGVVRGFDDGTYRPDLIITRDQACVFLYRAFYD